MNGVDDFSIAAFGQGAKGCADGFKPGAEVFPPMAGDQDHLAIRIQGLEQIRLFVGQAFVVLEPAHYRQQGVDHGVAGNGDAAFGYALGD